MSYDDCSSEELLEGRFEVHENRLWVRLLADAIEEIGVVKMDNIDRVVTHEMWDESVEWIQYDGSEVGSFWWICNEALQIDGNKLRRHVMNAVCEPCGKKFVEHPCPEVVGVRPKRKNQEPGEHLQSITGPE